MGGELLELEAGPTLRSLVERARGLDLEAQSAEQSCVLGPRGWRVELVGAFPVDWCSNLSLQCSAAEITIEEGDALRAGPGRWAGSFLLHTPAGYDPATFDFSRMARARPGHSGRVAPLELLDFELGVPPRASSPCVVRLLGRDRIGFLGAALGRFSRFGLHPHRLEVRTQADTAVDRFWLYGVGGSAPQRRSIAGLEQELRRLCRPRPPRPPGPEPGPGSPL